MSLAPAPVMHLLSAVVVSLTSVVVVSEIGTDSSVDRLWLK